MVYFSTLAGLLGSAALVAAAPTALEQRAACTFTTAAAAKAGKTGCASITLSSIAVPAGTTLDLTGLTAGTKVIFDGTTTFGYEEWSGPLISISGKDITVTGTTGNSLNGGGARWWDGLGSNVSSGKGKVKPKFFYAHSLTGSSSITGLNILNAPVQVISIDASVGLSLNHITIDNSAGDANSLGHNTDAFDIGQSSNIWIQNAIVKNQDDCVAINSGTNITFTGGNCSGGHGLSVGSVGGRSDNTVKDVHFLSSTISKSMNGVRVKTVSGATGSVSGVTYQDITLSGITAYGVVVEQDYQNGSPTGVPTSGVPITGLTLNNVHGTMSGGQSVYILCASCSNWSWTKVAVTGGTVKKTCKGIPSGSGAAC
ncbi:polygalacturonase 2 [Coleophoma cylindrospora]|uniref:endo-polygalacturonase n=1 Tax=Coleophoma cylindrospora TaxID=1849047 RepID=A0A3D8Q7K7_9HELO|nr:polygalacturonase 2 [Coleophoma cylindrospora]